MKTLLLAGGVSKRLWPLTFDKNLWPFYPDTLLSHNLKTLKEAGLTDVVLIINSPSEKDAKKLSADLGLDLKIIIQEEARGMGQAVLLAKEEIKGHHILVLNCDDIVAPSLLKEIKEEATKKLSEVTLVGKKFPDYFDGG